MIDATQLGQQILDTAQSFDGACGCAPFRDRMVEAIGFEIDWRPFHMEGGKCIGMSTCYVFARNMMRLCNVAIPVWHVGEPIGVIINWAKKNGAWQPSQPGCVPSMGDIMVVGQSGGTHVTVVKDCDGVNVVTIDGGQVCRRTKDGHDGLGRQMIAERSRKWLETSVVGTKTDPVVGWVVSGLCPLVQA